MHRALVALVVVLSSSLLVAGARARARRLPLEAPPAPSVRVSPARVFLAPGPDRGRRLRGDFEPPEAFVVAFTEQWSEPLADLIAIASAEAEVYLLADPAQTSSARLDEWIRGADLDPGSVHVEWLPLDSAWVRDYGPVEVREPDGQAVWLDAHYTRTRPHDDAVPERLGRDLGATVEPVAATIQGGAVVSNGQGVCAMTLEYVAEAGIDLAEDATSKDAFFTRLGCRVFAVVPGLADDQTHHADMFAQFLAPDVVAVAEVVGVRSLDDEARMDEAVRGLAAAAARLGQRLRVVRVPLDYEGDGKYRTYLNGVHLHGQFVVPSYADVPPDVEALARARLSAAMPGTSVIAVPASEVIDFQGSLHCISLELSLPRSTGR
jgi:agmatine/peptidylarginine deiminase